MRELIRQTFKFTEEKLASGVEVNAQEVVIANGKVISANGNVVISKNEDGIPEKMFSFNIYRHIDEVKMSIGNVHIDIDAMGYVREFISHVEK